MVELLAQHVANFGTTGEPEWFFAGEDDNPPHQNTVGYWWRKTLRGAGLSGIKLHDLRHFHASGLIAAGCDVVTVQRSATPRRPRPSTPTRTSGPPPKTAPARPPRRSCPRRSDSRERKPLADRARDYQDHESMLGWMASAR
ncbi:MAG: tyrosine-type recombinase/integrase [Chloroflexota bacterium]